MAARIRARNFLRRRPALLVARSATVAKHRQMAALVHPALLIRRHAAMRRALSLPRIQRSSRVPVLSLRPAPIQSRAARRPAICRRANVGRRNIDLSRPASNRHAPNSLAPKSTIARANLDRASHRRAPATQASEAGDRLALPLGPKISALHRETDAQKISPLSRTLKSLATAGRRDGEHVSSNDNSSSRHPRLARRRLELDLRHLDRPAPSRPPRRARQTDLPSRAALFRFHHRIRPRSG